MYKIIEVHGEYPFGDKLPEAETGFDWSLLDQRETLAEATLTAMTFYLAMPCCVAVVCPTTRQILAIFSDKHRETCMAPLLVEVLETTREKWAKR